jgi:hypothetical protein
MSTANNPDEKHQYRNKGDKPFKMICGVPKELFPNPSFEVPSRVAESFLKHHIR